MLGGGKLSTQHMFPFAEVNMLVVSPSWFQRGSVTTGHMVHVVPGT